MTDTELKALLRPYVARIAAAAQSRVPALPPAAEDPPACFSDGAPKPRRIGQQFSSEAVERYADYFGCDSEGNYPGSLHRRFGVDAQTFADRTGLVLKVGRDAGGKSFAQWSQPTYGAAVFSDGGDAATFAARGEGEKWQTGGRYYERSGGTTRRVPGPDAAKKEGERKEKSEAFKKDHEGRTPREHLEWKKEQAEPKREEARAAWEKAQADPSKLTTADTKALVDHLDTLTKVELKEHARKVEAKLSGLKRELVARLLTSVGLPLGQTLEKLPPGALFSPQRRKAIEDAKPGVRPTDAEDAGIKVPPKEEEAKGEAPPEPAQEPEKAPEPEPEPEVKGEPLTEPEPHDAIKSLETELLDAAYADPRSAPRRADIYSRVADTLRGHDAREVAKRLGFPPTLIKSKANALELIQNGIANNVGDVARIGGDRVEDEETKKRNQEREAGRAARKAIRHGPHDAKPKADAPARPAEPEAAPGPVPQLAPVPLKDYDSVRPVDLATGTVGEKAAGDAHQIPHGGAAVLRTGPYREPVVRVPYRAPDGTAAKRDIPEGAFQKVRNELVAAGLDPAEHLPAALAAGHGTDSKAAERVANYIATHGPTKPPGVPPDAPPSGAGDSSGAASEPEHVGTHGASGLSFAVAGDGTVHVTGQTKRNAAALKKAGFKFVDPDDGSADADAPHRPGYKAPEPYWEGTLAHAVNLDVPRGHDIPGLLGVTTKQKVSGGRVVTGRK